MPAIGIMLGLATAGQGGGYSPFTPAVPLMWHDASDTSSVTLNALDVASVADRSGNSKTAAQGVATLSQLEELPLADKPKGNHNGDEKHT